jgi:hypothetical protein
MWAPQSLPVTSCGPNMVSSQEFSARTVTPISTWLGTAVSIPRHLRSSRLTLGTAARSYTGLPAPSSLNETWVGSMHTLLAQRTTLTFHPEFFNIFNLAVFPAPRRQCQQRQLRRDQRPAERAAPGPDMAAAGVLRVILARRASKRGFPRSAS